MEFSLQLKVTDSSILFHSCILIMDKEILISHVHVVGGLKNIFSLDDRQHCTYYHWVLHTDTERRKKKKNFRLVNKKRSAITKQLLDDFQPKSQSPSKHSNNCEVSPVRIHGEKSGGNTIFIPRDPRSPYAFTLNVSSTAGTNNTESFSRDQVTCSPLLCLVSQPQAGKVNE